MAECDLDDVVCQLNVLKTLRELKGQVGTTNFQERFPEFTGLENTVAARIKESETSLKKALTACGALDNEDVESLVEQDESLVEEDGIFEVEDEE